MSNPIHPRLAVCSWSLQPSCPENLLESLEKIGIKRVQLALDPLRTAPGTWGIFAEMAKARGVEIVSGMCITVGEDYTSPETIRKTGGVTPDHTWEENRRNFEKNIEIARLLGLKLVTFHAGFLPHDPKAPEYATMLTRLGMIGDMCAAAGLRLGLETGQETATALDEFLRLLNRPIVGVNFDPANMLLYKMGDPVEALRILGPRLFQCHIKDAIPSETIGAWGEEFTVGLGKVNWKSFFEALDDVGFQGDLCIEREAGTQRVQDILAAKQFVNSINAVS